jgi:hypothetical protein
MEYDLGCYIGHGESVVKMQFANANADASYT